MRQIIFKPLLRESPDTIHRLLSESYDEFLRENPLAHEMWQRDWRDFDAEVSSHPGTVGKCGFFSYVNSDLVGFASLSIQHNFWQEGRILYITTMIVDEKHRNHRIGSALTREIETIARERGCKRSELESAFHRTDAHAFYEKIGFEKRAFFYSREVR